MQRDANFAWAITVYADARQVMAQFASGELTRAEEYELNVRVRQHGIERYVDLSDKESFVAWVIGVALIIFCVALVFEGFVSNRACLHTYLVLAALTLFGVICIIGGLYL